MTLMNCLSANLVVKGIQTLEMSIPNIIEMKTLATAKQFNSNIVSKNHLIIACFEFLKERDYAFSEQSLNALYSQAVNVESASASSGFITPPMSDEIRSLIQSCKREQDIATLLERFVTAEDSLEFNFKTSTAHVQISEEDNHQIKQNGFHVPQGQDYGYLSKIIRDKRITSSVIDTFLDASERYIWDGPYNTADPEIVTRLGQSQGRLFVTDIRIMFWSDDCRKPHKGIYYKDIENWKSSWMPLMNRGVALTVLSRKIIFLANSTAVKHAENQFQLKRRNFY